MKKTETYELNQWEASDRIRMEDFNADNAKLEAALLGKPGKLELIRTYGGYAGEHLAGHNFHMSAEAWNQWEYVIYVHDLHKTTFTEEDGVDVRLHVGDSYTQANVRGPAGSYAIVFAPRHDASRPIHAMVIGSATGPLFLDEPYSELEGAILVMTPSTTKVQFVDPSAALYGIR